MQVTQDGSIKEMTVEEVVQLLLRDGPQKAILEYDADDASECALVAYLPDVVYDPIKRGRCFFTLR
ncbi:hypothetical protein MSG_03291 [Mycobacterium shigaense]|uniref:Uncharacterized protein n=1 Tax=Mycobacterium shigaense TaxID=722731 RepID=A0A1Z4EKE0_9MYCO|nr:hypothetical protein MSG_03291 [Mycobacterium shigaense]